MEDPRIVKIGDVYYLTYTAYDGMSAVGAYAVSGDLAHFEKKGSDHLTIHIPAIQKIDDVA
ncbi:MAG: hypothetical protein ACLVEJ_11000 [Parabacteroides sp.]